MCRSCVSAWYEARRPRRVIDGCGGAGGAARGYADAGCEVTGVDSNPALRDAYLRSGASEFVCADILEVLADDAFMARFDAAHMSPPCQAHSPLNAYNHKPYPDLIGPVRTLLARYEMPYVIENVPGAPLRDPVTLCGYMFPGLRVERHRLFEAGRFTLAPPAHPPHTLKCTRNGYLPTPEAPLMSIHGGKHSRAWQREACEAMGTPWLAVSRNAGTEEIKAGIRDVCEAIPPAYTRWVASQWDLAGSAN